VVMADRQGSAGTGLGRLVKGWRRTAGLTQRELAARSGLSVSAVRDLEQGHSHRPRAGSLAALATALGLDAGQAAVLTNAARDDAGPAQAGAGPAAAPGVGLWVAVMGPVTAWRDGAALTLGPPGRRAVLALLALARGELVRRETIIDVLWGQRPPVTAAELVAAHVSKLRRVLDPAGGGVLAGSGAAGYRLLLGAGELDVAMFGELAARAGAAAAAGDARAACGLFEEALGLWRGEPAGDVAVLRAHPAVAEMARLRAQVVAGYAQEACRVGWHERVIPLLEGLARVEPLNERIHARLMVALAGAGQQAAAVAVFEGLRRRLDEELGVYPGAELAVAHERVLRQDIPAPADGPAAVPAAAMRTLPRDVAAFTGRDAELDRLIAAAAGAAGVVAIHAVDGMPGVGKTALVTHAAHLLAADFPDGQLFVGLHAHTPGLAPADPVEVLAELLACTGLGPREIPAGLEARAQRWRGRLAGKKVLLVLDDAAGHAQVEPLLPGTGGCLVLVTSRRRLIALPGAQPLSLDTLAPAQAAELFTRLAGRGPLDSGAVADLAVRCGYLPLAIALLAGRLAHHPSWTITGFAAEFAAAGDQLAEIAAGTGPGDPAVAAAFQMSYTYLSPGCQRLFRLLSLHPGTDLDAHAAAALAGIPLDRAGQDLGALYDDHLLDEPAPGRYRFHDLVRQYAATLTTCHDPAADRDQATSRLLDYYQHTAQAADRHLTRHARPGLPPPAPATAPNLTDQATATAWMRAERANLLACISYATTAAQPQRIISLTAAMAAFLHQEGPWQQAAALHHAAVTIARHHGDRVGEASALLEMGRIRRLTGDFPAAAGLLEQALAICRDTGDGVGEASALLEMGRIRRLTGDFPAAAGLLMQALAICRETGDRAGEASALDELGRVRYATGDYPAAAGLLEQALAICQDTGDRVQEASVLRELGRVRYATGDYQAAAGLQEQALAICQDTGSRLSEAHALHELGRIRYATGDYPAAAGLLEQALAICQDIGNRLGQANAVHDLARIRDLTGDYPAAAGLQEQALAIYQDIGNRIGEANALHELSRVRYATGDYPAAAGLQEQALAIYQDIGSRIGEAHALHELGRVRYATGDYPAAAGLQEQALAICQDIGDRVGEANALRDLALARSHTEDGPAAAAGLLERSVALFREAGDAHGEAQALSATGSLLAASARLPEAQAAYRQALRLARQIGSPLEEARALEGAASCAARSGDQTSAHAALTEATAIYQRIRGGEC
jgi:DNA-binding SARP family transcriptional activator/tetratricopeptide (TPR) repeat protein